MEVFGRFHVVAVARDPYVAHCMHSSESDRFDQRAPAKRFLRHGSSTLSLRIRFPTRNWRSFIATKEKIIDAIPR